MVKKWHLEIEIAISKHFLRTYLAKVFPFSFIQHRIYEKPCSLDKSRGAARKTIHTSVLLAKKHVKFKGAGRWRHFQLA